MIKRFLNSFKSDVAKDDFFGEVGVTFDEESNSYYLDKDIELADVHTPVILYLETKDKKASKLQFDIYRKIASEFTAIKGDLVDFLIANVKGFTKEDFNKKYRIESFTIPLQDGDDSNWEIDLLNLEDGFSHILVDFQDMKPNHYSVQG